MIRILLTALSAVLMTVSATPAAAQLGGITDRLGISNPFGGRQPITTSLRDARYADPSRDGFPGRGAGAPQPLTSLPRTTNGGFTLRAGFFEMHAQSYCLHAGTHGPGGGDGYLYAPLAGPAEDAIRTILRNSVNHPNIQQRSIQTLIWAILARAKFEDLSAEHRAVAAQLLTARQIAGLNRSALDLAGPALQRLVGGLPGPLRQIAQAEAQLRGMVTSGASYAEMERVAVLGGAAPRGEGSQDIPSGRWSRHPDGYWIRYMPEGYSHTLVQIYVEPRSAGVGREYDPSVQVAVPGNTSRQRLAQSGRVYGR